MSGDAVPLPLKYMLLVGDRSFWQQVFADGDAARGVDVGSGRVADVPACRLQQHIDIPPRLLFRQWNQDAPLFVIPRIFAQPARQAYIPLANA
jgi:hypothetical protein